MYHLFVGQVLIGLSSDAIQSGVARASLASVFLIGVYPERFPLGFRLRLLVANLDYCCPMEPARV